MTATIVRGMLAGTLGLPLIGAMTGPPALGQSVFLQRLSPVDGWPRSTAAIDVSADGTIVVGECSDPQGRVRAIAWFNGQPLIVDDVSVPTAGARALGVSADGTVVVGFSSGRPFMWTAGVFTPLPTPVGAETGEAAGVSGDGLVIVGSVFVNGQLKGLRWTNQVLQVIPDYPGQGYSYPTAVSDDGAAVVGSTQTLGQGSFAFRWDGSWTLLPGLSSPSDCTAWAVSEDGAILVGDCGGSTIVRWAGGIPVNLGGSGRAYGVSADGNVVVGSGFLWESPGPGGSFESRLDDLGVSHADWQLGSLSPRAISRDGHYVVGNGTTVGGGGEAFLARIERRCSPTDLNFDQRTDLSDLAILLAHFGQCSGDPGFLPPADVDRRGCVDLADLALVIAQFGRSCQ